MKTPPHGIVGVAAAAGLLLFVFSSSARAQDGDPPAVNSHALGATVDYGNDADGNDITFQPAKQGVDFDQLGLRPGQTVTVTVQFPAESRVRS